MAEDLTAYFEELKLKVSYLHSDVDTMERMEIIRKLRLGKIDVLVGINLLREGLDIPEVSLIAILDADKEGFLRSETSLVQTIGRAARNVHGRVILYGDQVTESMARAMAETNRRRKIQEAYNKKHHIEPRSIKKEVHDLLSTAIKAEDLAPYTKEMAGADQKETFTKKDIEDLLVSMDMEMRKAAEILDFERAASIRDTIREMKKEYRIE